MPFLSPVCEKKAKLCSKVDVGPVLSPEPSSSFSASSSPISFDDGHIRVACRVRPPNTREASFSISNGESQRAAHGKAMTGDEAVEIVSATKRCLTVLDDNATVVFSSKSTKNTKEKAMPYKFDFAIREAATQEEIFTAIGRPISLACMQGYNSTVLAYGQTGSGKSFTMFGPESSLTSSASGTVVAKEAWGIVPRSLEYIFSQISREARRTNGDLSYTCKCSFFEIFNERVFDLLDAANSGDSQAQIDRQSMDRSSRGSRNSSSMFQNEDIAGLQVRENKARGVYVDGLNEPVVTCVGDAIEVIQKGYRNRRVAETAMNRESSRSHAVFQLSLKSLDQSDPNGVRKSSLFTLVDLAGSERQSGTSAAGDRLKEANAINKSLSALGQVVQALVDKGEGKTRHIPFRDSKLTFLLRDSLGGNSRTFLVATVSPSEEQIGESLSTLKFSERAKKITNTAIVNEDVVGNVDTLKQEVSRLKQELAKAKIKSSHFVSNEKTSETSVAPSPTTITSFPLPTDELLTTCLERFVTIHKQSERYLAKTVNLRKLNEKHIKQLHAANLTIKLLRSNMKTKPGDPILDIDEKTSKILQELERGMLEMVEVNKWSAAVGEMRREIAAIQGSEDVEPSLEDLHMRMTDHPLCKSALSELYLNRKARDQSLGLGNGKFDAVASRPWSEEAEVKFQVSLQEKFTKVVEEKEALALQLENLMNEMAKDTSVKASSHLESVMSMQFGNATDKPSVDVLDFMAPRRTSTSRRSSVGRVGGRLSVGGDVSHWSSVQESNKKIRDAENKFDAVSKQLHEKSLELAEANKLNAVLAREKVELLAGGAVSAPQPRNDNSALTEQITASKAEIGALKEEIERIEGKRMEDQIAVEEAEEQLRALAQTEMDEATRQKAIAEKYAAEAIAEANAASEAQIEAAKYRVAMEEAKEAEAVALSRVKALEDDMETLSEQMEYSNAGLAEKTSEIDRLTKESLAHVQEIEASKRALESQKTAFVSLKDQIEASSKKGSVVEDLQQQLSTQLIKFTTLQDEQAASEQTLTNMTTALAKSEAVVSQMRQQLIDAQEIGASANEAVLDLKKEVWKLREENATSEATINHIKIELQSVKDDRDEVTTSLEEAERMTEDLREEYEEEKLKYLEELDRQQETNNSLEEALEAEQQMMIDEVSKLKTEMMEKESHWRTEVDVISANMSAALARAEQAEAEVGVLRNDTQRDVQEAESELLSTKHSLKLEEEKRQKLESEISLQTAKYQEQVCKVKELELDVENSTNSYNTIFARTVEHDVKLAAAEREAEKIRETALKMEAVNEELVEKLTRVESRVEELNLACVAAEETVARAEANAQTCKIMEQEAHERSLELERSNEHLKAEIDEVTLKVTELTHELDANIGHTNQKQKIHQFEKLRDENNDLKRENDQVARELNALKKATQKLADAENKSPLPKKKLNADMPPVPSLPLSEKNANND